MCETAGVRGWGRWGAARLAAAALAVACFVAVGPARGAEPERPGRLRVATYLDPPFSMQDKNGHWTGLAVELWDDVADRMGVEYDLVGYEPSSAVFDALRDGKVDVVAGAVSVTAARLDSAEYSTTFLSKVFSIATVPGQQPGWLDEIGLHLSPRLIGSMLAIAVLFAVSAIGIWLIERRRNPDHFGGHPIRGIGEALWWTAATVTTVGYGDRTPTTASGRIFAVFVMFLAIVLVSFFTGIVTSQLTVVQLRPRIQGLTDLARARVAVVEGSPMTTFLADRGIAAASFAEIELAVKALVEGSVDAVVAGEPELQYLANQTYQGRIEIVPGVLDQGFVGFALPNGSPLRRTINQALIQVLESDEWPRMRLIYLGR